MSDREQWAEDHGYYLFKCRDCGVSGWTDSTPECNCLPKPSLEDRADRYARLEYPEGCACENNSDYCDYCAAVADYLDNDEPWQAEADAIQG